MVLSMQHLDVNIKKKKYGLDSDIVPIIHVKTVKLSKMHTTYIAFKLTSICTLLTCYGNLSVVVTSCLYLCAYMKTITLNILLGNTCYSFFTV